MLKVCHQPDKMLRCTKILGGTSAVSEKKICTATKATERTLITVRRAMIRPSSHCKVSDLELRAARNLQRTYCIGLSSQLKRQYEADDGRN